MSVSAAVMEVEILLEDDVEVLLAAQEFQPALREQASSACERDAAVVQYREASSFFDALLQEREASSPAGETTPMEASVKEKVRRMSFLRKRPTNLER